jgi:hypothetical protein
LTPSFRKLQYSPPKKKTKQKNEPLSQEMHLKLRLSVGLKSSRPEQGRREAALPLFVKKVNTRRRVASDRCNFHLIIPGLIHVVLLER